MARLFVHLCTGALVHMATAAAEASMGMDATNLPLRGRKGEKVVPHEAPEN